MGDPSDTTKRLEERSKENLCNEEGCLRSSNEYQDINCQEIERTQPHQVMETIPDENYDDGFQGNLTLVYWKKDTCIIKNITCN